MQTLRPAGGSARGWSYFSTWSDCELRWFLKYGYPSPQAPTAAGLEPAETARPLLVGSLFHEGVEAYYRAGWLVEEGHDSGAYSVDAAVTTAAALRDSRESEWPSSDSREDDWSLVASLLAQYGQHYGAGGPEEDYPALRVASWEGTPALEIELATELPGIDEVFTSKFDAIMEDQKGLLWGLEHKTSAASRVHSLIQKGFRDGQISGQVLNLRAHFPNREVGGVILNAVVKDAAKGKPRFKRQWYSRTDEHLMAFQRSIKRKVDTMRSRMHDLGLELKNFPHPWDAAQMVFDTEPTSDRCYGFGRCDFMALCVNKPIAKRIIASDYVPRGGVEVTDDTGV